MLLAALMSTALAAEPIQIQLPTPAPLTYQTQTYGDSQYGWNAVFACGELKEQTLNTALARATEMAQRSCGDGKFGGVVDEKTDINCGMLQHNTTMTYSATVTYYCFN